MKLYRYWAAAERHITDAEGYPLWLRKWGGSNESFEAAQADATTRVEALATRLQQKADLMWASEYTYSTRDLPEELVEEISPTEGITRNRIGCLILNTEDICIADIDFETIGLFGKLKSLFKKPVDQEAQHLAFLQEWLRERPNTGVRAYRTAAGLRYIFTHNRCKVNEKSIGILTQLGSDKLYVRLCREQQSYRARLSPKPWRVAKPDYSDWTGMPTRYPRLDAADEADFAKWSQTYARQCQPYATCRFIGHFGKTETEASLAAVIELHDRQTEAFSNKPLA